MFAKEFLNGNARLGPILLRAVLLAWGIVLLTKGLDQAVWENDKIDSVLHYYHLWLKLKTFICMSNPYEDAYTVINTKTNTKS